MAQIVIGAMDREKKTSITVVMDMKGYKFDLDPGFPF